MTSLSRTASLGRTWQNTALPAIAAVLLAALAPAQARPDNDYVGVELKAMW